MEKIKYKKDEQPLFFKTLQKRVNEHFQTNKIQKTGNLKAYFKAIVLLTLFFTCYATALISTSLTYFYLSYIMMGSLTIFVALNIAHDAAHNTFSSNKSVNNFLLFTFDLLGANGYLWRLKHVHSHHTHVNIPNMDGDIKQSNLVRIFPNAPFLNFHKYQFLYMPPLYMLYTLNWLLMRDFKDFFQTNISGKPEIDHHWSEYVRLFLGKFFYISKLIIIPYIFLPFTFGQIFLGFLLLQFAASLTVALALVSAHVGEHSVYPEPDENGIMPHSWAIHQIVTTTDFATNSPLITHLFGGFNHHVVHHLFPNISHIHYPVLTQIVKETCEEFDIQYNCNPTLIDAILSHMKFLRIRSKEELKVSYIEM